MTRIQDNLESAYEPVTESGCWIWMRALSSTGYGTIHVNGKSVTAHRYMYQTLVGPIPEGLHVLHKCDVRCCVNPTHLFLGTNDANVADMVAKGRQARGEAHGAAKLTVAQVLSIRADPRAQRIIAKDYGVSQMQISNIKRRKWWQHQFHPTHWMPLPGSPKDAARQEEE